MLTAVGAAMFALAVGYFWPPLVDRVFWAIVVTAMMQAVCAQVDLLARLEIFAWPATADVAAAMAVGHRNLYIRMTLSLPFSGEIVFTSTKSIPPKFIVARRFGTIMTPPNRHDRWNTVFWAIVQVLVG
jgi:hypothetical protein